MRQERLEPCADRIKQYLSAGGLFNPELMEHEKVRDLLIACREELLARRHSPDAEPSKPRLTGVNDLVEFYEKLSAPSERAVLVEKVVEAAMKYSDGCYLGAELKKDCDRLRAHDESRGKP